MKRPPPIARLLAMLALVLCMGCYDGRVLLHDAQSSAQNKRSAEIDLGRFLTTLPRDRESSSFTELNVHLFATVSRSRVTAVKRQIKVEDYRLRHDILAALRGVTPEELAEPSLAQLRKRIEAVLNSILADHPVKSVGFYQIMLRQR